MQCRFTDIPTTESLDVQDSRVKAAIALNPLTSEIFGEVGLSAIDTPTLIVSSLNDYFVPALPEQIEPFYWLDNTDSYLLTIEAGTHFSVLSEVEEIPLPLPDFLLGPSPELAQPPVQVTTLTFFNRYLLEKPEAETYLNQTYLDTFDIEPLRFNIVHNG